MSNEWEVVIKGGKHKLKSQMTNKEKKKMEEEALSNNKFQIISNGDDEDTDKSQSPTGNRVKSKGKQKKKPSKEGDIFKLINNISGDEIKKIHNELSEKFPNNSGVILRDLAMHIDFMLPKDKENYQNNFNQIDFPSAFLSKSAFTVIRNIMNTLSNDQLCHFIKQSMILMINENDSNSIGIRLLLQICLKTRPSVLITERKTLTELFNSNRDHTIKFKQLTWVIRQACINFNISCQIWLIYLLPFITQKCHVETVIQFGEQIQNSPLSATGNDTNLLVTDFVPVLDLLFTQNDVPSGKKGNKKKTITFQLNEQQQSRLRSLYPKIKEVAFLTKSSNNLQDYFASFFVRLTSNNDQLNNELLSCIDYCLSSNPEVIDQLSQLHNQYPKQTTIILSHLQSDKCKVSGICKSSKFRKLKEKIYKSTIGAPVGSSKDKIHQITQPSAGFSFGSCFKSFITFLIYFIMFSAMITFVASKQFPKEFEQFRNKIQPFVDNMMERAIPVYNYCYSKTIMAYDYMLPYMKDGLEWTRVKYNELYVILKPHVDDLVVRVEILGKLINKKIEEYAPIVLAKMGDLMECVQKNFKVVYDKVNEFIQSREFQTFSTKVSSTSKFYFEYVKNSTFLMVSEAKKIMGYN